MTIARLFATLAIASLLGACAQYDSARGVAITWQPEQLESFRQGVTTRGEVMAALGPPSQLVSLGDESVLYYLNEASQGAGLILLLYNRFEVESRYDRAVFIFDAQGVLSDFSTWIVPLGDD